MMTAGRMEKFREGWALALGSFGKAHFYVRRGAGPAYAICGAVNPMPAGTLHAAGDWTRCKRCEARLLKAA